jgi:signal transduction histidine kinase
MLYALLCVSSPDALWFKITGSLTAGIVLLVGAFEFKKHSPNVILPFWKSLPLVCGLLLLFNLFPIISLDFLVSAYSRYGGLSRASITLFYISGIFFLLGALPWLNSYYKHGYKENLLIGLFLVCQAELFFASKFMIVWTFFWWFWHLLSLILFFSLAIYLLSTCIRKSLTWKIVLSLTMLFIVTIVVSFWAIRKYYEMRDNDRTLKIISADLSLLRGQAFSEIKASVSLFLASAKMIVSTKEFSSSNIKTVVAISGNSLCKTKYEDFGWISSGGNDTICFSGKPTSKYLLERVIQVASLAKKDGVGFSIMKSSAIGGKDDKLLLLMASMVSTESFSGYIYHVSEGAFLLKRTLNKKILNLGVDWQKLIIDMRNREIVYSSSPESIVKSSALTKDIRFNNALISLTRAMRKKKEATILEDGTGRDKFLFFADLEPFSGWLVVDYSIGEITTDAVPIRVHIIVAMSAMLLGIVIMLIMINIQIHQPLKKLIKAVINLQSGNFDFRVGTKREDEIGVVENIFDQAAERLKILYGNLQNNVRERENALLKVRKVEKEKRDFFNALSHELKNPIHCIINFSRFGMKSNDLNAREYFEKNYENAMRLLSMIEDLLQIAKIEAIPKTENIRFNLRDLIKETIWMLSPLSQARNIKFTTLFLPEHAFFNYVGDRKQIRMAFSNILENAIKYTYEKTEISVSCEELSDAFLIKFSDEGPGLKKDEMEKLFQEFQRSPGNKKQGSGLGLYISKKIISMHGGTIYATNNPVCGVTFCVMLPVQNEQKT